jgi:hypothetical protein
MEKIIILEDSEERIKHFQNNLIGCDVFITQDIEKCIEKLKQDKVDYLFLDHDLNGNSFVASGGEEKTGYDVAKWLNENPEYMPHNVILHSLNSVGRKNMKNLLPNSVEYPFVWLKINIS